MNTSEASRLISSAIKENSGIVRREPVPGHRAGANLVIIFAALWTQFIAAVTLVLMWFSWQDPLNLAWPDNERLILMSATLVLVLVVSYVLASRFRRKQAANRGTFSEIWYTSGAAAGAWFGLPLYLSVTWDHLVGGGHDAFTIISVGAIFVGAGGVAGLVLALPTEFLARRIYEFGRIRGAQSELRQSSSGKQSIKLLPRIARVAVAPLVLAIGGLLTFGLLFLLGPGPLSDPAYAGAIFQGETQINGACLSSIRQYSTNDSPVAVLNYYKNLASPHKYVQLVEAGKLDKASLGLFGEKIELGQQSALVRYSNTPFQSNSPVSSYSPYRSSTESCRSIRVFITPANQGGTLLQVVSEKPAHVH